ncbi:MAG: hypothetical protein RLZZ04_4931 [Cyanobacteriota bacterium]
MSDILEKKLSEHDNNKHTNFREEGRFLLEDKVKLLNQAKKGTVLLRESKIALSKTGVDLLDTVIYDRSIITDSPSQGQVVWQMSGASAKLAASEYDLLFQEVWEILDGKN